MKHEAPSRLGRPRGGVTGAVSKLLVSGWVDRSPVVLLMPAGTMIS
ncbi:Uncharacterised protein [Burkholderia pseudomallei]|nr:Uncharacterised protein [Burkholderia pseudomallei]